MILSLSAGVLVYLVIKHLPILGNREIKCNKKPSEDDIIKKLTDFKFSEGYFIHSIYLRNSTSPLMTLLLSTVNHTHGFTINNTYQTRFDLSKRMFLDYPFLQNRNDKDELAKLIGKLRLVLREDDFPFSKNIYRD
jgi:hypothetical protein